MKDKIVYWKTFFINGSNYLFAATVDGLCYVECSEQPILSLKKWTQKNLPTFTLDEDKDFLMSFKLELELDQYFKRERVSFSTPLVLHGTPFQIKVWQALQTIPYGQTKTYSEIAEKIGQPTAVRAVASAIGANPLLIFVPCHRVIGKNGSLTGFRSGLHLKEELLTLENAVITR